MRRSWLQFARSPLPSDFGLGGTEEEDDSPGQHERDGHEEESGTGVAGDSLQQTDQPRAREAAQRATTVDQGHHFSCNVSGQDLGNDGKEWAVGRIHCAASQDQESVGQPEAVACGDVGAKETQSRQDQEGPDEALAAELAVRELRYQQHEDDRKQIWGYAQEADGFNSLAHAGPNDGDRKSTRLN